MSEAAPEQHSDLSPLEQDVVGLMRCAFRLVFDDGTSELRAMNHNVDARPVDIFASLSVNCFGRKILLAELYRDGKLVAVAEGKNYGLDILVDGIL